MKELKRTLSLVLCLVMLVGVLPVQAFAQETAAEKKVSEAVVSQEAAAETTEAAASEESAMLLAEAVAQAETDEDLTAALEEAKEYTDALTINNSSNDPATVVSNFGTHFTWDNEKRESSKSYLFDWSYYNGVVFEGLEYLYEVTGEEAYKDYVVEYMSSLIASDGTWAMCSNNSSMQCAGYNSTHGADCYKTASLLLDAYEMTGDNRYLTIAETLYADLDTAAKSYSLTDAGNNYRHTWASDPEYDLWLDGLYMILPFRAEYAKRIGDTEELDLIVSRMQWVSDEMYDSENTGLFYHAANNENSDSGSFWLRSIGWYAAAIVDIMDSMEGDNFTAMQAQLVKLVDAMKVYQNESNGMWVNNLIVAQNDDTNPYETSGTALICYAVMKAVNNGWLDESYADMAILAFKGICDEKLSNNNLTDICFKGAPSGSSTANSDFSHDNEGKGVGPFIMFYAEVQEYVNAAAEAEPTEATVTYADNLLTIQATALGLTAIEAENVTDEPDLSAYYTDYVAYNVSLNGHTDGNSVKYSFLVPENMDTTNLTVYYVAEDGSLTAVPCEVVTDTQGNQYIVFTTTYVGTFALGAVSVPEGYTLASIAVSNVVTTKYFVGDSLDLVNPVVTATYTKEGSEDFTRVVGVQDDPTYEASGYDMTVAGKQTVIITYEGCETSFDIEVFEKVFPDEATGITAEVTVPGTTAITAAVSTNANVKTAMNGLLNTYAAYDITLSGYNAGESVTVTMPIVSGDGEAMVYYVPESGAAVKLENVIDNGTTVTFTTDHFSTYVTGRAADVTGSGNLVGGIIYTLDTDGVTTNKNYLIVNTGSDGTGYALTNNSGSAGSTTVTISNSTITVEDDTDIAWQFSGADSGTVGNNGRFIYPNQNSLSLSTSGTSLTISNQNNGAYRIYLYSNRYYYYLRYNNGWTGSRTRQQNSVGSVYLYEFTSSSSGEAVTFTVTPGSKTIQANESSFLSGTVTVAGETVDLSTCTITWESSDTGVVTVNDGTITGVADGTADITATLTAVNGTSLVTPIELTISVTVDSPDILNVELSPKSGTVYVGAGDGANTRAKVITTYDNGTVKEEYVYLSMVSGEYDTSAVGDYSGLTVTYGDYTLTDFTLHVVEKPDMNYPEYPDPGSVMIDKYIADASQFQSVGVAEVNLTASGLPAEAGVDVILVTDLSNSMAWTVGTRTDATSFEDTKMRDLQQSIEVFADTFLVNDDGTVNTNTVSLVTFGGFDADNTNTGYDGDYADVTQTVLVGAYDPELVKTTINNIQILAASGYDGGYKITFDGGATYHGNYGNTNYDYAFMETYSAVNALKAQYEADNGVSYAESGRSIYILFMTDGAPTNYDGVYYRYQTSTARPDVNALWRPTPGAEQVKYTMGNNGTADYSNAAWFQYIAGGTYDTTTGTIPGNPLAWATEVYNMDDVENIYSIGFDIDNGGFSSYTFTETDGRPLAKVLENLVDGQSLSVYEAEDASGLQKVYENLASELKLAATNAYFVDQMGGSFNIQMASTVSKYIEDEDKTEVITLDPAPKITISTQTIYTADDVNGTTITDAMVGEAVPDTLQTAETVTFNDAGTEAYSDQSYTFKYIATTTNDAGETVTETVEQTVTPNVTNILVDGVIYGENFWYNTNRVAKTIVLADGTTYELPAETFYWNIGTINNQEFIMSYYVYLAGSAEGQANAGTYATNNYATLYYENWLGNDANQSVDSPVLAWESASVYYGFYLVDVNGNPVTNRATGATGTFADAVKVTTRIFYDQVLLNTVTEEEPGVILLADSTVLPEGYTLYDPNATYTIVIDSTPENSYWQITNGKAPDTTYVTDYHSSDYSNATSSQGMYDTGWDLTSTTAWFAVLWEPSTLPDVVVIDYGLPVDISALENDMFGTYASLTGLAESKPEGIEKGTQYKLAHDNSFLAEYEGDYGVASIQNSKVRYTPNNMQMPGYDKFAYEAQFTHPTEGVLYYYGDVTVIPATTIYYEDDFVTYSAQTWSTEANAWAASDADLWTIVANSEAVQAEDRPGEYSLTDANNIYGYDGANQSMSTYSLNGYAKASVDYDNKAIAEFDFYGTGFDVISMTDNTTGTIIVEAYSMDGETVSDTAMFSYAVDTYYGYQFNYYQVTYTYGEDGWTATAKTSITEDAFNAGESDPIPEPPAVGDTYTAYECGWEPVNATDDANSDKIYQVPVMKIENLPYGKYRARIQVLYEPIFEHNEGSTGYDFYLDAIRIYDPANDGESDGSDDTTIEDAYVADGEGWPTYFELRNLIIAADTFGNAATSTAVEGIVFIDGDTEVGDAQITDYVNYGPNNEVYLAPGQRVAFMLNLDAYVDEDGKSVVDNVHIGIKSANGDVASYTITNINQNTGSYYNPKTKTVATTTDMYYDLTPWANDIIVISNYVTDTATSGIISLTNIKVTFTSKPVENTDAETQNTEGDDPNAGIATASEVDEGISTASFLYMTPAAATMTLRTLNSAAAEEAPEETTPETTVPEETVPEETVPETTVPETTVPEESVPETTVPEETEPETFEPDEIKIKLKKGSVKAGQNIKVTVTTSRDVAALTINGVAVSRYTENRRTGERTWTATIEADEAGTMEIEVVAYSAEGVAAEAVTEQVTVKDKRGNSKKNERDNMFGWLFG